MTKRLKYTAQECKDIRGIPPKWYDFDTLAITYGIGHTDAMFIEEASPDSVLALLAEHDAITAERDALQRDLNAELAGNAKLREIIGAKGGETMFEFAERFVAERDALAAKVVVLREALARAIDTTYSDTLQKAWIDVLEATK
jgi:hypothetical protein